MSAITDTLNDIDIWLTENAPVDRANLLPPATGQDIARAETTFARALPEDVRSLYAWHDGAPNTPAHGVELLPGWPLLCLADSAAHWRSRNELYAPDLDETGTCFWWRTSWMPLGYDFTGELFVAEMSPNTPTHGAVFHASMTDGPRYDRGWPSLDDALADVADTLAADNPAPLRGLTPVVTAGRLEWRS